MHYWLRVVAYLLAMVAGLEILCRVALTREPNIVIDPHFDRLTAPDQPLVQASEGFSNERTNELGHLDSAMPTPLPSDGILVIGDSLTEARQVAMTDRFTDRLSAMLNRRVYNVGHTGWSPLNAIGFIADQLANFAPQTIIVQVSGNDFDDFVASKRPHLVERNGQFAIEWPDRTKRGMAKAITTVREAVSRSAFVRNMIARALLVFTATDDDGGGAAGSCEQPRATVVNGLPWVLRQLTANHPDVRLLYLPMLDYHAGCVDRCAAARELWRTTAAANHIAFIDATHALCDRFQATDQPMHGFANTIAGTGHLNALGHDVVARELAAALRGAAQ